MGAEGAVPSQGNPHFAPYPSGYPLCPASTLPDKRRRGSFGRCPAVPPQPGLASFRRDPTRRQRAHRPPFPDNALRGAMSGTYADLVPTDDGAPPLARMCGRESPPCRRGRASTPAGVVIFVSWSSLWFMAVSFSYSSSFRDRSGSAKWLPDLPVVTKRVGDASNPPTVALGNRCDFRCSCGNGLREHRVRVVYGQDHADRSTVLELGAGVDVLLKPEVRPLAGQLSDHHLSAVILKAVPLDPAERGLVIVHRLRGPADRQPRGDAGLDRF